VATYGQQLIVFHGVVGQLWIAVNTCEQQFGWRRSADRTRLQANSLLTGNFTGNFTIPEGQETILELEPAVPQRLFGQFPTQINRENISRNREFISRNREFHLQTRKLRPDVVLG
jgi:hypothetical protein